MVSGDKARLHELDTIYGVEDLYDLLEVMRIDAHNRRLVNAAVRQHRRE